MPADITLNCRDCGQAFTFTQGEQEFFASRGFSNSPSRCPDCRAQRKSERGGGYSSYSSGGDRGDYGSRGAREMFTATCAACGQDAVVPFQPSGDKPVYCSTCFEQRRGTAPARSSRGRY